MYLWLIKPVLCVCVPMATAQFNYPPVVVVLQFICLERNVLLTVKF